MAVLIIDGERLAQDPAMRVISVWRGPGKPAASTNPDLSGL
jgi:hypothetical protein